MHNNGGRINMMKVFVVTAYYSDYEWQREDLVGVYDSEPKALTAQKEYEDDLGKLKLIGDPRTEEEQELKIADLPDDRWEIYFEWLNKQSRMSHFESINIQEIELNGKPILYEQ